jgi:hypothetical protein
MAQREFADYMTRRQLVVDERLEQVWSWIEQDRAWEEYHEEFREFENDYPEIVPLVRQARDAVKLKQEAVNTILVEWGPNASRGFSPFSLHTVRAIRKCAVRYSLAEALEMAKRAVLHRLSRTGQGISRSLLPNAADWSRVALNLYERGSIGDEILEEYKVDDSGPFLRRGDEPIKFTQLTDRQSRYLYRVLELELKGLPTPNPTPKKPGAKQPDVATDGQDTTIDKDATIGKDATTGKDVITGKDTTTDKDATGKDVATEGDGTIGKEATTGKDTTGKDATGKTGTNRAKHPERDQTNSCDCRGPDEFWKNDLQRHDRDVHGDQGALLLFSPVNYTTWVVCNMHHTALKNAFGLRDHSTRRVLTDRMNRIWRRRWNTASVRRRHPNWFN